ncbi:MAG: ubiquinone/menaquinone biosynthesis C-methylase UbiE [Pseudohongiellaceae bacterium]|jgi:ubiquinone/menaquinone biosynthesis C-methylase UbiE
MSTTETYREFYEYEADVYKIDEYHESAWKHRRTLVERLLPKRVAGPLLDSGCGDGALSVFTREQTGAEYAVGLDLSVRRAQRAQGDKPAVHFLSGSIYELPFPDDHFELVLCTDLLEHLDEPQRAFDELVRVSSKHVLISVPYSIDIEKTLCPHCMKDYFIYGHQHSFGKQGLSELAERAGAQVTRFEHVIPMFECRRYKWFPPLKWLIWGHFKNSGTLGALIQKGG